VLLGSPTSRSGSEFFFSSGWTLSIAWRAKTCCLVSNDFPHGVAAKNKGNDSTERHWLKCLKTLLWVSPSTIENRRIPAHFEAIGLSCARERDIWMILCNAARFSVALSQNRRRGSHWSMQHSLDGAVLANDRERGVRPRSSWLREPSKPRANPAVNRAHGGGRHPWRGCFNKFYFCVTTRSLSTRRNMLYIFHVDTGTTITFDIKLALQR